MKNRVLILAMLLTAGCNSHDLATSSFRDLPHVVDVQRFGSNEPTRRIIHLLDWHYVSPEDYDGDHDELMMQVERVQAQQIEILQYLIKNYGLREVFVEGLTDEVIFKAKIDGLREIAAKIEEAKSLGADVTEIERWQRHDLLRVGAVGRMNLDGADLVALPLEEEDAYEAAIGLEPSKIEARQDAQVRQLTNKVCFVILGGANDLSDNILPETEYVRIATSEWERCSTSN